LKRREFISLLGGAAAAWPVAARAQQAAMPVIGFLGTTSDGFADRVAAFREGLKEAGYIEGQNVAIEYRWAENHYDRLPALAADLILHRVAAIVAGAVDAAHAAKAATSTVPIVFLMSGDPVTEGLVASLNQPGGNLTGVTSFSGVLSSKRLELLHELVPTASFVAVLINLSNSNAKFRLKEIEDASLVLALQTHIVNASNQDDIDATVASLVQRGDGALLVIDDPLFLSQRIKLVTLAARYRIPTIYFTSEFVDAGGLISYATDYAEMYRQIGRYTGQILKGAKPADLPVVQPTRLELVINLKTAGELGLTVPPSILLRADKVIE
jgi:putative tryptophan/tyrosine transport system substrate-binding protein